MEEALRELIRFFSNNRGDILFVLFFVVLILFWLVISFPFAVMGKRPRAKKDKDKG